MSEAIKRFYPDVRYIGSGDYVGCMEAEADGEYVLYSDHAAEVERLRREQVEFAGAVLCALGVNRDESVAPGNQVLAEVERLRGQVAEDADAIRRLRTMYRAHVDDILDDPISTESEKDSYLGALAVIDALPAVRRALGEIGGEG